jgi:hypothetical protein
MRGLYRRVAYRVGAPPYDNGVNTPRYDTIRLLEGTGDHPIWLGHLPVILHLSYDSRYQPTNQPEDPGTYTYSPDQAHPITCAFAPETFSPGGLVWGASGFGKSRLIMVLAEDWSRYWDASVSRRFNLIDPKAETFEIMAMGVADQYLALKTDEERQVIVDNFRVHDVLSDRFAPANLFAVPSGMSASLVAEIRATTALEAFQGDASELVEHGIRLMFDVATALGVGLTMALVRGVMDKALFRERILSPKLSDTHLRERLRNLESTLPERSRAAVVRRFEILLAERTSRLIFGVSPATYKALLGEVRDCRVTLQNYGPSLVRPARVALSQAMNAVVSAVNDMTLRKEVVPDMLVTEETGQLVRNATVARYLIDASRTLRWKGIALVCCAQDPTNAFPPEVLNTLALNARWFAAFQSARSDAALFEPHLPTEKALFYHNLGVRHGESVKAFYTHMASLPRQHFVFLRKGLSAVLVKTITLADLSDRRAELLETFYNHIATRSMVRFDDAERLIEEEQHRVLEGEVAASVRDAGESLTVDALLSRLTRSGQEGTVS